ncbi:MAG: hypothetical protein ACRDJ4_01460 [Actinomycetota bacterium]
MPSWCTAGRIGGPSWPAVPVARVSILAVVKPLGGGGVAPAPSSERSTVAVRLAAALKSLLPT